MRTNYKVKYTILNDVNSLWYFKYLFNLSDSITIKGDLEITPYTTFVAEYAQVYWYFQYIILKDGHIEITSNDLENEYEYFFSNSKINFEWINIIDKDRYELKCIDGKWYIEVYNQTVMELINSSYSDWVQ